jgi:hypothetical protein
MPELSMIIINLILGPLGILIGIINVFLLLYLIKTYWKTYKDVKSEFTIGLLFFGTFLLIQNIIAIIFMIITLNPIETSINGWLGPKIPLFLINVIQIIALSILYKITSN